MSACVRLHALYGEIVKICSVESPRQSPLPPQSSATRIQVTLPSRNSLNPLALSYLLYPPFPKSADVAKSTPNRSLEMSGRIATTEQQVLAQGNDTLVPLLTGGTGGLGLLTSRWLKTNNQHTVVSPLPSVPAPPPTQPAPPPSWQLHRHPNLLRHPMTVSVTLTRANLRRHPTCSVLCAGPNLRRQCRP